ncbi:MAG: DNA cytosine methyltransferase, partial [Planktothrix sp.]
LFDGMSCGQIALNRLGVKYDTYFASEIDSHAIKVTTHNYPSTIQLGDVTEIKGKNLPPIHLLIGGSPCQGFSAAGDQLNFSDPRSKLFFEFVRILKETNPTYFLLENVKMKKEYMDIISKELGVQPILINSNLVSAQNRERLYWTNIPN